MKLKEILRRLWLNKHGIRCLEMRADYKEFLNEVQRRKKFDKHE